MHAGDGTNLERSKEHNKVEAVSKDYLIFMALSRGVAENLSKEIVMWLSGKRETGKELKLPPTL